MVFTWKKYSAWNARIKIRWFPVKRNSSNMQSMLRPRVVFHHTSNRMSWFRLVTNKTRKGHCQFWFIRNTDTGTKTARGSTPSCVVFIDRKNSNRNWLQTSCRGKNAWDASYLLGVRSCLTIVAPSWPNGTVHQDDKVLTQEPCLSHMAPEYHRRACKKDPPNLFLRDDDPDGVDSVYTVFRKKK